MPQKGFLLKKEFRKCFPPKGEFPSGQFWALTLERVFGGFRKTKVAPKVSPNFGSEKGFGINQVGINIGGVFCPVAV